MAWSRRFDERIELPDGRKLQIVDPDYLKVFANDDAAETWLQENDPEGVAFEYEVLE
jgi:hypothetical protein